MEHIIYTAGFQLDSGFQTLGLFAVWIIAFALGVWQYGQTKGHIGRPLMTFLGGGSIATLFIYPDLLIVRLPELLKRLVDFILQIAGAN